ncbi:aromatic-ring hydroxylase C-terminal domain-containing protein [Pseudonocardia humida]
MVGRLTGIGIAYRAGGRRTHPWTGRRVPDVRCAGGRLYELLRGGRFLLLDSTDGGAAADAVGTSPRVLAARCTEPPEGWPAVVLVRPDGYVAWAGDDRPNLGAEAVAAVARWCGPGAGVDAGRPADVGSGGRALDG